MPPNNSVDAPNSAVPPQSPPPIAPAEAMLDADEHVVTIVHRSFIGIVFIYLEALGAIAALLALAILAFPGIFSSLSANSNMLLALAAVFAIALIFLILFLATYIYRQSKLIVTDKNLIQILQRGLFVRKISRLSMSNVEDVTAEQKGILPTVFNYGTLTVQTAGEMENFVFPYCPNPNKYANSILDARQAYADRHKDE